MEQPLIRGITWPDNLRESDRLSGRLVRRTVRHVNRLRSYFLARPNAAEVSERLASVWDLVPWTTRDADRWWRQSVMSA